MTRWVREDFISSPNPPKGRGSRVTELPFGDRDFPKIPAPSIRRPVRDPYDINKDINRRVE